MGILEWQCNELRRLADKLYNKEEVSVPFVRVLVIPIMREAADTIEGLRDRLQELQDAGGESRYSELFGTPERAARTIAKWCAENDGSCAGCPLFMYGVGIKHCEQDEDDMPSLLEWLMGDAK